MFKSYFILLLSISVVTVTTLKSQPTVNNNAQNVTTQKNNQHNVRPNHHNTSVIQQNLSRTNYNNSNTNKSQVFNKVNKIQNAKVQNNEAAHKIQTSKTNAVNRTQNLTNNSRKNKNSPVIKSSTNKLNVPKYVNPSKQNGTMLVKMFKSSTRNKSSDNPKLLGEKGLNLNITSRENENGLYFQETLNSKLHLAVLSNTSLTKLTSHGPARKSFEKIEDNTKLVEENKEEIIDYGELPNIHHVHHDYDDHTSEVLHDQHPTPQVIPDINVRRPTRSDDSPSPPLPASVNPKSDVNSAFNWLATGKPPRSTISPTSAHEEAEKPGTIAVIEWRWPEVGIFFAFASFVVATGIFRAAFHRSHFLLTHVPESCLMIALGAFVGAILFACGVEAPGDHAEGPAVQGQGSRPPGDRSPAVALPVLSPRLFFNVLIPPVILEAAFTLYDRAVMANIYPILLHAVIGKFLNAIVFAAAMLLVDRNGFMGSLERYGEPLTSNYTLSVQDAVMYSAIASGVDSAAVLPIFEENGVNKDLFFVLLGESLLNDAVTVTMSEYTTKLADALTFEREQYGKATLFLIAVSLGGLAFGIVGGLVSALVTRATHHCAAVEPLALLALAYMSYISAELIQFSGHICIMGCGLVQAHYAFKNISHTSYNTVKDLTKMISSTSEAIIFLFLGMVLVSKHHLWHTGFVAWTIVLCLACRIVVVVLLCSIYAALGGKYIVPKDQIVLSYCGLRGAVCFCLAHMANPLTVAPRQLFITSLLALIIFSTFIQGGTVKYLIDLLQTERSHWGHEKSVVDEFHDQILCLATSGIEEIIGASPSLGYPLYKKLKDFDDKYLSKIFLRQHEGANMSRLFNEYSQSYNLALLQHQLFLAIRDAQHDKKHSKILMVMPTIFSNLVRKMGPQILPMVYFGDDGKEHNGKTFRHINARTSIDSLADIPIKEEDEEEEEEREGEKSSNKLNQSNGLIHLDKKDHLIIEDVEAHEIENKEPPPVLPSNENQKAAVIENHAISEFLAESPPPLLRDRKSNRATSVIERAINRVIQPPAPVNRVEIRPVNPSIEIPNNNIPSDNQKKKTLDIIHENKPLDATRVVRNNQDQADHPTNGHQLNAPGNNATDVTQEFPAFVLSRNTSKEDGSEPARDILIQSELTTPESHALNRVKHRDSFNERKLSIPQVPPIINLVGPSPESTSRRIFNAPSSPLKNKSKRMSARKIPLFRPGVHDPPFSALRHRRVSLNNRPHSSQQQENLNATAQSLRRAVLDSPYRRMRYQGRHRELEADYERLTQAVLSRHLQMIDDELQLVAEVVTRCHTAIDQLRSGKLSRATRPVSEPSNDYARELAARLVASDDTSGGRTGFQTRRQAPATAPETSLRKAVHNEWRKMFADAPRPRILSAETLRRIENKVDLGKRHIFHPGHRVNIINLQNEAETNFDKVHKHVMISHQKPHVQGMHPATERLMSPHHEHKGNQHHGAAIKYKKPDEANGHATNPYRVHDSILQHVSEPQIVSPHPGQAINHHHGSAHGHLSSPHQVHHPQGTRFLSPQHVISPHHGQHVGNHVQYATVQIHDHHPSPSQHIVNPPVASLRDNLHDEHAPRRFSSSNNPPLLNQNNLAPRPFLPPHQPPIPHPQNMGYGAAYLAQVVRPNIPNFVPNTQASAPKIPWYTTRHPYWQREPTGTLLLPISQPPEPPPRTLGAPLMTFNDTREIWESPRRARQAHDQRKPQQLSERPPWK